MTRKEATRRAIKAGCAYWGINQQALAKKMGIRPETLSRKMKGKSFTEDELEVAQKYTNYLSFMEGT